MREPILYFSRHLAGSTGTLSVTDDPRTELESLGFVLEDDEGGTRIRPARF